jgi:hypothetical protein
VTSLQRAASLIRGTPHQSALQDRCPWPTRLNPVDVCLLCHKQLLSVSTSWLVVPHHLYPRIITPWYLSSNEYLYLFPKLSDPVVDIGMSCRAHTDHIRSPQSLSLTPCPCRCPTTLRVPLTLPLPWDDVMEDKRVGCGNVLPVYPTLTRLPQLSRQSLRQLFPLPFVGT